MNIVLQTFLYCVSAYLLMAPVSGTKQKTMNTDDIVPDVLDKAPTEILEVSYKSGVKATVGNVLTPTQVKDVPTLKWNADPNTFYLVAFVDPDAPSRENPKFREWLHWLHGNVPGSDLTKGDVLADYVGSGPPKGSGLHRYIFLIYKQPGKVEYNFDKLPKTKATGRASFSIKKFASQYNLGDPIVGNYYKAEYDDYVPELHKQLKD